MTRSANSESEKFLQKAMLRYDAQAVLFQPHASRLALSQLQLPLTGEPRIRINVWRNHAFEGLLPLMEPYCAYAGWQPDFRLSAYDDSLSFIVRTEADVELLWLDSLRFLHQTSFHEWATWLETRVAELRRLTVAPIILATWGEDLSQNQALRLLAERIPAAFFADVAEACSEAGVSLLDMRSETLTGTPLGKAAQLSLARKLACHWLPATIFPPVKAIALDLDQTLHRGVLGEDGVLGVELTPSHAELQRHLKELRKCGIFLALVSRNEREDVEELFNRREDFPLGWGDFSVVESSWNDKGAAIQRVAESLRIAPDSILFVDDNPGELASVSMQIPEIQTLRAETDATLTLHAIRFYPGIWRWKVQSEDSKRIQDMMANTERTALAHDVGSPEEYFRTLHIRLLFRENPREQIARLADLCNKTNQFNLALRRFNQAEIAERMNRKDTCVTSVQLVDRFADSGIIAVVVAERQGTQLVVEELCISCRALGRQLEGAIILTALQGMPILANCSDVVFRIQHGPRNGPALTWLQSLLSSTEIPSVGLHSVPAKRIMEFHPVEGVTVNEG